MSSRQQAAGSRQRAVQAHGSHPVGPESVQADGLQPVGPAATRTKSVCTTAVLIYLLPAACRLLPAARRLLPAACCLLPVACRLLPAQTRPSDQLAHKQETQNQVREMAHQLVSGILDLQLQRLEENGMQSRDMYRDVRAMRENIEVLVRTEMPEVIELLGGQQAVQAHGLHPVGPEAAGGRQLAARRKSRQILVRLLVQRQNLLRRLRIARIADDLKRLIETQTEVLSTTRSLPEQPSTRREHATRGAIESQRDVKAIYLPFKQMLREVSDWGGPLGVEATAGLRLLDSGDVDQQIDRARRSLETIDFADAVRSQRAVIKGLRALLQTVQRAQGLVSRLNFVPGWYKNSNSVFAKV